jgi:hypothetical protein
MSANQAQGPPDRPAGSIFRSHPNVHIDPRSSQVSTGQEESNKATARRFSDATNTGDAELISKTIDELVEPDALIRTPLPLERQGRKN